MIQKLSFTEEYGITREGHVYSFKTGKPFKLTPALSHGYPVVSLHINKIRQYWPVHRLIATEFIEIIPNKTFVNHKDGDKTNNNVSNLEWCTNSENGKHAHLTGLCDVVGENNPLSKHSDDQIHEVCDLLEKGYKNDKIHKLTGTGIGVISAIRCGNLWKHISKGYYIKRSNRAHFDDETIHNICKDLKDNIPVKQISSTYKIKEEYVRGIRKCHRYKKIASLYFNNTTVQRPS